MLTTRGIITLGIEALAYGGLTEVRVSDKIRIILAVSGSLPASQPRYLKFHSNL